MTKPGARAAPGAPGPAESEAERLDRNLSELLQELRVAQAGVQILFAFLLTLPFQQRFGQISAFHRNLYAAALMFSLVSACLLIAPVSFHRLVFRLGMRRELVDATDRLTQGGLLALAAAMSTAVLLVLEVVLGSWVGRVLSAVPVLLFTGLWYAYPISVRRRVRRNSDLGASTDPSA